MTTNMDKLYEAVAARGPVCVGLDTDFSYLPEGFAKPELTAGENIVRFNKAIVDATKDVAGCFKVQIAYYESLGLDGIRAYKETLDYVKAAGMPVIAEGFVAIGISGTKPTGNAVTFPPDSANP